MEEEFLLILKRILNGRCMKIFLVLVVFTFILFLGGLVHHEITTTSLKVMSKNRQEVTFIVPKKPNSSLIIDQAKILEKGEKKATVKLLRKIQSNSPEKMRFIIYNQEIDKEYGKDFIIKFATALSKIWTLGKNDVLLLTLTTKPFFFFNEEYVISHLIVGKNISHYFAAKSRDFLPLLAEKGLSGPSKEFFREKLFVAIAEYVLERVQAFKEKKLKESHMAVTEDVIGYIKYYESRPKENSLIKSFSQMIDDPLSEIPTPILAILLLFFLLLLYCYYVEAIEWICSRIPDTGGGGRSIDPSTKFKDLPVGDAEYVIKQAHKKALEETLKK